MVAKVGNPEYYLWGRKHVINMFDWKFQQDTIMHTSNEHPLELKNKTQKQKWKKQQFTLMY